MEVGGAYTHFQASEKRVLRLEFIRDGSRSRKRTSPCTEIRRERVLKGLVK